MWLEIALTASAILLIVFWFDSVGARDTAISIGRELSARVGLQLLDETVACSRTSLARNAKGQVQIQRHYDFDVSVGGADRLCCQLTLLGRNLVSWHIPPYPLKPH